MNFGIQIIISHFYYENKTQKRGLYKGKNKKVYAEDVASIDNQFKKNKKYKSIKICVLLTRNV
jgi:hypothetical protein